MGYATPTYDKHYTQEVIVMAEGGKSSSKSDPKTVVRTCSKTKEKFTFFFGKDCVFSQWHSVDFRVGDVEYNCAEQYMMHQKAGKLDTCLHDYVMVV